MPARVNCIEEAEMGLARVTIQEVEKWKSKGKTKRLVEALTYPGHNTRKAAVTALESLGWEPASDEEKVLFHIGKNEFDECVRYGETAVQPLIDVSSDDKHGDEAAKALAQLGDPALEKLTEAFRNMGYQFMSSADESQYGFLLNRTLAYGFHHLQFGEKGKEKLLALLNAKRGTSDISAVHVFDDDSASPAVKITAAEILSREGDRRILPFIEKALDVKGGALYALSFISGKRAAKKTALLLSAVDALGNLGDPAYFDLAFKARSKIPANDDILVNVKKWENAIVKLITPETCEKILHGAIPSGAEVSDTFINAMITLGPSVEDRMIAALNHSAEGVRQGAAKVLGGIGSKKAVPLFAEMVNKIDPKTKKVPADVRAAGEALKKIDTPEAKKAAEEFDKKVKGKCFIATAVYGECTAPEVMVLRSFRDNRLLPTPGGRFFVSLYYAAAPRFIGLVKMISPLRRGIKKGLDQIVRKLS